MPSLAVSPMRGLAVRFAASSFVACITLAWLSPAHLVAQSLRGSRASVAHSYRYAVGEDLHFYETTTGVRTAARTGRLVALSSGDDYELARVSFPYVTPTTRLFVERFAAQYHRSCGDRLVVTSAVRPDSRQPANASDRSVHPTGIAVDFRKPSGPCLAYLRKTLKSMESRGLIDATEERRPPHFHVVVFTDEYADYVKRASRSAAVADDVEG
jgi:uncharacterized protein DUF5715